MSSIDPREYGQLEANVKQMQLSIEKMAIQINHLTTLADKSKGALWSGMTLASVFGGIVTFLIEWMLKK